VTPKEANVLMAAKRWAKSRGPIVSVGNAEHFARMVRAHEAEETAAADELELAVALLNEEDES
jgi:hypothetical protein